MRENNQIADSSTEDKKSQMYGNSFDNVNFAYPLYP